MNTPGIIHKLDETVVNRIAAGEVIQRPANALKEMIENSLDAQSTSIQVVVKAGGIKFLQIQDNGTGIRKEDLDIVCERFTTSKLKTFEDLSHIETYGFRGEALASISHIAHVTIVTKTKDSKCAYRINYFDGKPKELPKPCAGNQGTQIIVEDLFYNMAIRKCALKNASEEYSKIVEVVSRYAIHNAEVAFSLKKYGESISDVQTIMNSSAKENIRVVCGVNVARELLDIECEDNKLKFKARGLVSNANYSIKKVTFLLFINNRLVDSCPLRKAVESVYSAYIPKNTHPFIYLSLDIAPQNIDVNMHPTKHEVRFLYEEEITEKIVQTIDSKLLGSNVSRTFLTQTLLPTTSTAPAPSRHTSINGQIEIFKDKKIYDHSLVRTDSKEQKLEMFFKPASCNDHIQENPVDSENKENSTNDTELYPDEYGELSSLLQLRQEVQDLCHEGLHEIIKNHSYVGAINRKFALFQHDNQLHIASTAALTEELFYQLMLKNFGSLGFIQLTQPATVSELVKLALSSDESQWSEAYGSKENLASYASEILMSKAEMLDDYFSLKIDEDGKLCALPNVLEDYTPSLMQLPMYILRLATEVEWKLEKECFDSFCRETASFYTFPDKFSSDIEGETAEEKKQQTHPWAWTVQHVLYPAIKKHLNPPKHFAENNAIVQIASTHDLYRVFERC